MIERIRRIFRELFLVLKVGFAACALLRLITGWIYFCGHNAYPANAAVTGSSEGQSWLMVPLAYTCVALLMWLLQSHFDSLKRPASPEPLEAA